MGKVRKISDKNFFAILRKNAGLYARTAKAIKVTFDIEYSRQAVKQRAEKKPEMLRDIDDENIDFAEEGLHALMTSANHPVRFKAIELYLKTKGKGRGYIERQEIGFSGHLEPSLTNEQFEQLLNFAREDAKARSGQ